MGADHLWRSGLLPRTDVIASGATRTRALPPEERMRMIKKLVIVAALGGAVALAALLWSDRSLNRPPRPF